MPRKVIVVEHPDEARIVAAHLRERGMDSSETPIVALEPAARAVLKGQGLECADTLPYFDNAAHARALVKTDALVRLAEQDLTLDVGNGLESVFVQAFIDRALWSWRGFVKTIEVLHGIGRAHPKTTLVVCSRVAGSQSSPEEPRFLGPLAPRFCRQHGIPLEVISATDLVSRPEAVGSGRREPGARGTGGRTFAQSRMALNAVLDRFIARGLAAALHLQSRSESVLAPDPPALLVSFLGALRARFPQVKPLLPSSTNYSRWHALKHTLYWLLDILLPWQIWDRLPTIPLNALEVPGGEPDELLARASMESAVAAFLDRNADCFAYRDVSFLDELGAEAREHWIPALVSLWRTAQAQAHVLARLRPPLVLAGHSLREAHVFGKLCAMNGIPAMVIPVKMLVKPKSVLESLGETQYGRYFVSNEYPFAAAQTPLALGYLKHTGYAGRAICTGPLIRSKVDARKRARRRQEFFRKEGGAEYIVVFAPSMRRIPVFHVVQTLDEVISGMVDLVEAAASLEGVHLVLRLHPSFPNLRSVVEMLVGRRPGVSISVSGRLGFDDILALADVIVSNASTAAEDAILNGVPVILYDKWVRYNALDAPQVITGVPDSLSPAYYVTLRDHLATTLEWVLRNHPPGTAVPAAMLEGYVFQEDLNRNFYDFVGHALARSEERLG